MRNSIATLTLIALVLSGCATVPPQLAGQDFAAITPQQAASENAQGPRVRWGGEIIRVEPKSDRTCIEVLSRELHADARPNPRGSSDGRFIACGKGFYDPAIYTQGREVTVVGRLAGTERRKVGEYDYTYATVDADSVYLWPHREYVTHHEPWWPYYYDPFWGPWWWAPAPVVIVHNPPPPHH